MGDVKAAQFDSLLTFGEVGIGVRLLYGLPGVVCGFPAQENDPFEISDGVVLHTDEAEGVDHAVAHGDALDDVERHQRVALSRDERRVEIPQDCVSVVRSPAEDVRREDPDEHHDRLPPAAQAFADLLRLETRHALEPEFPGDAQVTQRHGEHRPDELHGEDEEEVRAVVQLLVHRPNLGAEGFAAVRPVGDFGRGREVCRRDGNEHRDDPHPGYETVCGLELHSGPQGMNDGHIPKDDKDDQGQFPFILYGEIH